MGYSEVPCRICGVSFNIGRIRRPGEPQSSGWTNTGDGRRYADGTQNRCSVEDGCKLVKRPVENPKSPGLKSTLVSQVEDDDDDDDGDYREESSEEEEEYEFYSDDDLVEDSGEDFSADEVNHDNQEREWYHYLKGDLPSNPVEELLPLDLLGIPKHPTVTTDQAMYYEHLAGPNCKDIRGYSGHLVTVEEMRGCGTLQCLVPKNESWQSELDDLDFETRSNWFLSGLGDHMPSYDANSPLVTPARHGAEKVLAGHIPWEFDDLQNWAMPFHPTCFDIFTRLSRLSFGHVDISGLMAWYRIEDKDLDARNFAQDPNVKRSKKQWWHHETGREYLAANPLFVPRLGSILRSVIQTEPSFDVKAGAFALPDISLHQLPSLKSSLTSLMGSQDVLLALPQNVGYDIISYLGSKDIASLRLATRAFRQLPILLWRRLLREEMPWVWEAWSDDPPYIWATVVPSDPREAKAINKTMHEVVTQARSVIEVEMPELLNAWVAAENAVVAARTDPLAPLKRAQTAALEQVGGTLPVENTNWYELYRDITRHWADLKGLRNRQRIWSDVEKIISRIQKYRAEGQVVDL